MPLWKIVHTPGLFTETDRTQLSRDITDRYEKAGLPRFYVVVTFAETDPSNIYVGGEQRPTVRVEIAHIARHQDGATGRRRVAQWVNDVLATHLDREGLHWEFHIDETSEELWMINGYVPPPGRSEAEKAWRTANRPMDY
ncbi:tautomerase family protein [Rhodococcus sp. NBC_00294]|uniref:tautomerase family protein n=1 Tax=Rhodococcus sp. NBC_00294 TaxID=2976004 RepID=UPI002E29E449|nr:tautomerase family protein [Rhodococcus sp. NBC_00294]